MISRYTSVLHARHLHLGTMVSMHDSVILHLHLHLHFGNMVRCTLMSCGILSAMHHVWSYYGNFACDSADELCDVILTFL